MQFRKIKLCYMFLLAFLTAMTASNLVADQTIIQQEKYLSKNALR